MKKNINSKLILQLPGPTSLNSESVLTALTCTLKSVFLDNIARSCFFVTLGLVLLAVIIPVNSWVTNDSVTARYL